MLGRACSSFKIMITAGTTKMAAMMRTMSSTKPTKHPRRVSQRRDASRAGSGGAIFCRGGRITGAFGVFVGMRRGAGAFGAALVGGGLPFGDCAGWRAGVGVVPLGG